MVDQAATRMAERQRLKRSELVREEVIEAALAEFADRGYHQTSIAHIAKRLGAGHSMFYRYFENKRDILEHVVRHAIDRIMSTIGQTLSGPPTSLAEFRDFSNNLGLACIDLLTEDPRLARLMLLQSCGVDREMTEKFCRGFDEGAAVLSGLLRAGIAAGYVRGDIDVEATADSVVAIPFGVMLRHGHQPDREVLAARVRATVDMVCRGIAAEAA
ncbi:TetR/AcrR family transcriptional regulator [Mycobacterium hubeiense]|uniref:TetR/AcrR family transcriptional regulator n=1 Tax=Mycobacterium hubeiense TaxID=1867256 RepID=UPI001E287C6B|nr:TetR/AcrR family transcriptional regulator [Mycobacterium sp. QGD 101]